MDGVEFGPWLRFGCMQFPMEPRHFKLLASAPGGGAPRSNCVSKSSCGELLAGTCEMLESSGTAIILSFRTRLEPAREERFGIGSRAANENPLSYRRCVRNFIYGD